MLSWIGWSEIIGAPLNCERIPRRGLMGDSMFFNIFALFSIQQLVVQGSGRHFIGIGFLVGLIVEKDLMTDNIFVPHGGLQTNRICLLAVSIPCF